MDKIFLSDTLSYTSFLEMGKDVYLFPGRFYKLFLSKSFLSSLYEDKERYRQYLLLKKENPIPDVFLFKMSYILNPYISLRYHHFIFSSYEDLGKRMLSYGPVVDVYLKDLIVYRLLSFYMVRMGDDKNYPDIYSEVLLAEKSSFEDAETSYWKLAFFLGKTKELTYEGERYKTPEEFFSSRLSISSLVFFSSSFLKDKLVLTWLRIIGEEEKSLDFKSLASLADAKEAKADELLAASIEQKIKEKGSY